MSVLGMFTFQESLHGMFNLEFSPDRAFSSGEIRPMVSMAFHTAEIGAPVVSGLTLRAMAFATFGLSSDQHI